MSERHREPIRAVRPGERIPAPTLPGGPRAPLPEAKPVQKEPRKRHRVRNALLAGAVGVAGVGGYLGISKGLERLEDEINPFPTGPRVTGVEPIGPSGPPSPDVSPSSPPDIEVPVTSEENVRSNIEAFFNDFSREDLNNWGEQNVFSWDVTVDYYPWQVPEWPGRRTQDGTDSSHYQDGNINGLTIQALPQLGAIYLSEPTVSSGQYFATDTLAVNLGVFKKGGNYFVAAGLFAHPDLAPKNGNGTPIEQWVQFYKIYPTPILTGGDDRLVWVVTHKYQTFGLSGYNQDFAELRPEEAFKRLQENVGNALYISTVDDDVYSMTTAGLLNQTERRDRQFQRFVNQGVIIPDGSPIVLPNEAPESYTGIFKNSSPILPSVNP